MTPDLPEGMEESPHRKRWECSIYERVQLVRRSYLSLRPVNSRHFGESEQILHFRNLYREPLRSVREEADDQNNDPTLETVVLSRKVTQRHKVSTRASTRMHRRGAFCNSFESIGH